MTDLPIVFLSCRVFETLLLRFLPAELKNRVTFLDYVLHRVPKKLTKSLVEPYHSALEKMYGAEALQQARGTAQQRRALLRSAGAREQS